MNGKLGDRTIQHKNTYTHSKHMVTVFHIRLSLVFRCCVHFVFYILIEKESDFVYGWC